MMAPSQDILPPPVPHPTLVPHSNQGIIEHPNGSDGWLPAEKFDLPSVKQDESNIARRFVPKRKSAFRTRSPSRHTTSERRVEGTTLVNGTPAAIPHQEDLQNRAVSANNSLTPKQRSRIEKSEAKDGKRISKIIKQEGRSGKWALVIAIKELEGLQKFQQNALKSEARAHDNHSKSLFAFKKTEADHLNAKMRYEAALAELHAEAETLETLKNNSKEATEHVQEKSAQVDSLRTTLAVDERERELKLSDLKGSTVNGVSTKRSSSLWRR